MLQRQFTFCVLGLVAGSVGSLSARGGAGTRAPAVEPDVWLNHLGDISWKSLEGRLILVEKWATW